MFCCKTSYSNSSITAKPPSTINYLKGFDDAKHNSGSKVSKLNGRPGKTISSRSMVAHEYLRVATRRLPGDVWSGQQQFQRQRNR
jgi:hypothetical protein